MRFLVLFALAATPAAAFDHAPFDGLLRDHVRDGRIDYTAAGADARLASYLAALAAAEPDAEPSDTARLALWLNAYNALVIRSVVDHQPLESVTAVRGFFDTIKHTVAGREVTLDQLENEIIRPFGDARIHAALVCGAVGCPPLLPEAYAAERLDEQLDEQCRAWLSDPGKVSIDRAGETLWVAMAFKWYADDFERAGGPAGFVKQYLGEDDQLWIAEGGYTVRFLEHDWRLNGR